MEFTADVRARLAQADKIAYDPQPRDLLNRAPTRGLLIVTDGVTPRAVERAHTPTFDALAQHGVRAAKARTVFPTITGPAHTSLLTGARVAGHGFLYPKMLDAYGNRLLDFSEGRMHAETIAEAWRERGITTVGIGSRFLRGADAFVSEGVLGEDFIDITDRALDALQTWQPYFLMVVFYVGDTFSHLFGPEADETLVAIEQMDAMTARILDAYAGKGFLDDTVVAVLADHGHASVNEVVQPDFVERVGALPHGRVALFPRELPTAEMRALLADSRVEDVYGQDELELLGAWGPRWGEHVITLREGLMFLDARGRAFRGYHGAFTEIESHIPFLVSGAGIKAGARLDDCEIIDLAPTFSTVLGGAMPQQNEGRILWEALDTSWPNPQSHAVDDYLGLWREKYALLTGWKETKRAWACEDLDNAAFARAREEFSGRVAVHSAALQAERDRVNQM